MKHLETFYLKGKYSESLGLSQILSLTSDWWHCY